MSKEDEIKKNENSEESKKPVSPPPKPEYSDPSRLIESELQPSRGNPARMVKGLDPKRLHIPKDISDKEE